jgi:hypothetical protein
MRLLTLTPSPSHAPPLIPRKRGLWERGDSDERVRHPMTVDGHDEQLFGLPLNARGEGCQPVNLPTCQPANVITVQTPR